MGVRGDARGHVVVDRARQAVRGGARAGSRTQRELGQTAVQVEATCIGGAVAPGPAGGLAERLVLDVRQQCGVAVGRGQRETGDTATCVVAIADDVTTRVGLADALAVGVA